jgi:hypothetical protein
MDARVAILSVPVIDVAALVTPTIDDLQVSAECEGASMPWRILAPAADPVIVVGVLSCASDRVGRVDSETPSNPRERADRNVASQDGGKVGI